MFTLTYAASDNGNVQGAGTVTYVVDGDTMFIRADSQDTFSELYRRAQRAIPKSADSADIDDVFRPGQNTFKARIGNINTAESEHRDKSRNTRAGKVASNYAKDLMSNKRVKYACWDTGYYLRPICSVWTEANSMDFATVMIEAGHSSYSTKYGKHPFWHDHYKKLVPGRPQ